MNFESYKKNQIAVKKNVYLNVLQESLINWLFSA